ncbi:dTDP-4-amino-4,6-dideoxygalactose transaminase [Flammeovirga kamogawensis]|uniref:dTDP-4-amino-4,6-dideoxygalactose transaminase n=1 Tax=Flammeovirga kamogawensis TaxID=373891 RepID=A0ABX8GWW6_9BACT|nr:dTDP-4-amino-4,6-dideoxygalactose transaminase [Flammeovirga kamogawensis]MBB6460742.1 dTDP-4-amino-4,6-dideoxygalactose transaminase [Flammeovirga kamogawensis]QWG08095.1 dTDP-4-amino-4,6-dideoxygalactose transaminase [Flammeovirga kamogawensis]
MEQIIPFNKPYLTGKEAHYLYQAVYSGHISGNGNYTKKCQSFFEEKWSFRKTLLTTSCTDALEMCALLLDIDQNDEVIVPSYTFVSSALAFERQGAQIVFADSRNDHPGIDEDKVEALITPKTKAIVVVHYAGVAVDMDIIMEIAKKHNIYVIEDAAQAIDSFYKGKPLGSIGHFGTFSFHETKNIQCGEGGLLAMNDESFINRAEIIWEKGTNRAEFFRGEANKYGWKDTGSSFLPSELNASFLYAQLENLEDIQNRRKEIWQTYYNNLKPLEEKGFLKLPTVPKYATNNGHMFYIILKDVTQRSSFIEYMADKNVKCVFHYLSLHQSDYYLENNTIQHLKMSDYYSDCLVRLPLYYELSQDQIFSICKIIIIFLNNEK